MLLFVVHRCVSSYWSGAAAVDGLCCYGYVICLSCVVVPFTQMVKTF